jgi:hypothetical protein
MEMMPGPPTGLDLRRNSMGLRCAPRQAEI